MTKRQSLVELFDAYAQQAGPAFTFDDGFRTWTYTHQAIARKATQAAAQFRRQGIAPGGKVILWAENRPGWIIALWACLLEGITAVPIDYRSTKAFVDKVQRITGAAQILTAHELAQLEQLEGIDPASGGHPKDLAQILFTSGATAEPKGVLISHRNLLANLEPVEHEIRAYRRHPAVRFLGEPLLFPIRFLNLLPLSHLFGQTMAAFIPPMIDGHVWFARSQNPQELARLIKGQRLSVVVCVPKMMELLKEHVLRQCPEAADPMEPGSRLSFLANWWKYRRVHRLFGWKFWTFVVGAAPLDPELEAFWRKLGYVVIQGYGLTETAPIVSLNHPFHPSHGTVGKPIAGVEIMLADDGEILVKGENVTEGYYQGATVIASDGWFHTGDIGERAPDGAIRIRGRKKEMIVTPEGMNVFPDDLERVLLAQPGVLDAAAVEKDHRPHAVLILQNEANADVIIAQANQVLEEHQRIRAHTRWPDPGAELPRTEGTRKLKRHAIRERILGLAAPAAAHTGAAGGLEAIIARYAPGRALHEDTTLDQLGLGSLERVQLLLELEEKLGRPLDENVFTGTQTIATLAQTPAPAASVEEPIHFPVWARSWWARAIRNFSLPTWVLPLARVFLWINVKGRENLKQIEGPVIFASNHQSYLDTPALLAALPARFRRRVCPAMRMEFFDAHFHPEKHGFAKRFRNSLGYYLAALMFHAFPLPQREAGVKQALRYSGSLAAENWSLLLFPEGRHSEDDSIGAFQPGVGMMAAKLGLPVVPVRLRGVNRVLHPSWRMARPGRVTVTFGAPLTFAPDTPWSEIASTLELSTKSL